jgi:hypothetical protein
VDLGRNRSHLGALGVQPIKGLQKGSLNPCCYVGRTGVRAKGQRCQLTVRSCFIQLTRRLRVGELAEPICSNHDRLVGDFRHPACAVHPASCASKQSRPCIGAVQPATVSEWLNCVTLKRFDEILGARVGKASILMVARFGRRFRTP